MVPCPRGKRIYERARASPADVTWHTRGPTAAARVCIRTATSSAASRLSASLARVRSPHGSKYLHRPRFKSPECLVRNRYRVPKRLENSRFIRFYRYYNRTTTRAYFSVNIIARMWHDRTVVWFTWSNTSTKTEAWPSATMIPAGQFSEGVFYNNYYVYTR